MIVFDQCLFASAVGVPFLLNCLGGHLASCHQAGRSCQDMLLKPRHFQQANWLSSRMRRLIGHAHSAFAGRCQVKTVRLRTGRRRMHREERVRAFVGGDAAPAGEYHDSDFDFEARFFSFPGCYNLACD